MLYSEIFRSIQGEGVYTGVPTVWLRLFGCNLECNGFGQEDPTDPDSYILPYQEIDLKDISVPEQLPVFDYGCDSSYSWSRRFKKLQRKGTPEEVAHELFQLMYDRKTHVAFTGGEPLMKAGQKNIVKVIKELKELFNDGYGHKGKLTNVTFETNGTRPLTEELTTTLTADSFETEFFFSRTALMYVYMGHMKFEHIQPYEKNFWTKNRIELKKGYVSTDGRVTLSGINRVRMSPVQAKKTKRSNSRC